MRWLNNRRPSLKTGPVSLPPPIPASWALAIIWDPGPLLVQPVCTFPAYRRWQACWTVAPALPICFCCCPQPRAEPQSCPRSARLLWPWLRMPPPPHPGQIRGCWLVHAQPSTRCGPRLVHALPQLSAWWYPERAVCQGPSSPLATSLWVGSWGAYPCSLHSAKGSRTNSAFPAPACVQLVGKPGLGRRVESRADRWGCLCQWG